VRELERGVGTVQYSESRNAEKVLGLRPAKKFVVTSVIT
jgi:hypothetical protein